jgi:hypothetical protein
MKILLILSKLLLIFSQNSCVNNSECNYHGNCINNTCICDSDYNGIKCNISICNGYINNNGICMDICNHGTYIHETDTCNCNNNWKTSRLSDTPNYLEGTCTQFTCQSDTQCQTLLNISSVSCPFIYNNCLCPIKYANFENNSAKCANVFYTIVWNIILLCQIFYINAYKYFIIPFLICLPFGKNRARCECHTSWFGRIKKMLRCIINCNGECTTKTNFSIIHDFALSIWVFKMAVFSYLFVSINEFIFFALSSYMLWLCTSIVLLLIGFLILMNGWFKNNLCEHNSTHTRYNNEMYNADTIYIGEREPTNNTSECCSCTSCRANCFTRTFCCCCLGARILYNWLFSIIPQFPNNLWGGFFGFCVGTHSKRNTYIGGNCFIDFMSLSCFNRIALHSNAKWLHFINSIIHTNNTETVDNDIYINRQLYNTGFTSLQPATATQYANGIKIVEKINYNPIHSKNYYDIENKTCCICMNDNVFNYCEWISCSHCFCKECTIDMINHKDNCKFPCPLCREISNTVLVFNINEGIL